MKITIINQHCNNFGDEAAFIGLTSLISNFNNFEIFLSLNSANIPKINQFDTKCKDIIASRLERHTDKAIALICCICPRPPISLLKLIPKLNQLYEILQSSDVVLVGPGGENIGSYKDWLYLLNIKIALLLNKKVIFSGNSFAPASHLFDYVAKKALQKCTIIAREEISLTYIKSLHLKAHLGCDCAMLMPNVKIPNKQNIAIFVPNQLWKWHPNFINKEQDIQNLILNTFNALLENYEKVVIIPQTHPYPNKIEDFTIYENLYGNDKVTILPDKTPSEQIKLIGSAQCLVGMRYHSIVFASIANTPALTIGYERKMKGFNQRFYNGKGYIDASKFDINDIIIAINNIKTFVADQNMLLKAKETTSKLLNSLITDDSSSYFDLELTDFNQID